MFSLEYTATSHHAVRLYGTMAFSLLFSVEVKLEIMQ
nr:MAG TPA: hypothetical protein [Caudoviricetes sp.]